MSMQSDVTVALEEDEGLQETVVDLMKGSGFYGTLKAQIAEFIVNTGELDPSKFIRPERADENVLMSIYEYLQWVGMKQTCSMLLFESPVKIDASSVSLSAMNEPEFTPKLQKLMARKEDSSAEENVGSQNVVQSSGDVPVLQQEKLKNTEKQVNINVPRVEETAKSSKTSSGVSKSVLKKRVSEERLINFSFEESTGLQNEKNGASLETCQTPSGEPAATNEEAAVVRNEGVVGEESSNGQEANTSISDSECKDGNGESVDENLNSLEEKKSSGGKDGAGANDDFDDLSTLSFSDMLT